MGKKPASGRVAPDGSDVYQLSMSAAVVNKLGKQRT